MKRYERRNVILKTAARIFSENGYYLTSISDIIHDANIARGTFYLYFKHKRDLFDELLDNYILYLSSVIKSVDMDINAPPPMEQMRGNIQRTVDSLLENNHLTIILLNHTPGIDYEIDKKLYNFYSKILDLIERSLIHGIERNLIEECNTKIVSYLILGSVKELLYHLIVKKDIEMKNEELTNEIFKFNLNALRFRMN